jgi:hypothetical protein
MTELTEFDLTPVNIPDIEEARANVSQMNDGVLKRAKIVALRGYLLLSKVTEEKATSERLAWLNLVTQSITAVNAGITAFESRSNWTLKVIQRAVFEWELITIGISGNFELLDTSNSSQGNPIIFPQEFRESQSHRTCVARLRAYTAFCLWSDRDYYKKRISGRNMQRSYTEELYPTFGPELEARRVDLFFDRSSETDQADLDERRVKAEGEIQKEIDRIGQWLADPTLQKWTEKLSRFAEQKKGPMSYWELIDVGRSVPGELQNLDLHYAYSIYMKGSMALHGSTFDQFLEISTENTFVFPKIMIDDEQHESELDFIVSSCNVMMVLLASIDQKILNRPELRE